MLLVADASRKLADAVLSILIEWPPCCSGFWDDQGSGRPIGAESWGAISLNSSTFGTTTRRLAQLCPVGRQPRSNSTWARSRHVGLWRAVARAPVGLRRIRTLWTWRRSSDSPDLIR